MYDIAHISSNPLGSASYSEQVAEHVIRDREKDSDASSTDQAKVPLSHIDDDFVAATSLESKSYPQSMNGQPQKDAWDGMRMGVHNHSVWRKFLDAVLEPRTLADENGIIEYLRCYRHDLPPAVWIENRRLRPD
jgi:hypothetical protein